MHFCTILTKEFLLQGIALYRSLERFPTPFTLWILCGDGESLRVLRKADLPGVMLLTVAYIEAHYPELPRAKSGRTPYEYIATLKPYLVRFLLETQTDMDAVFSLDGDLWFFSDPAALWEELGGASILLSPHRFSPHLAKLQVHGMYNGGFVAFRNDGNGRAAAVWWSDAVREWCGDRVEGGKRSNQKYLEELPKRFAGVKAATHPGFNTAPWNLDAHVFAWEGGRVLVSGKPIVFHHFHHLRFLRPWLLDPSLALHRTRANCVLKRRVYAPYVRELLAAQKWLRRECGFDAALGSVRYEEERKGLDLLLTLSRVRRRQWFIVLAGRMP